MRIALICPTFPPDHCGVGDYTFYLAEELIKQGHEVGIWSSQTHPARLNSQKQPHFFQVLRPWNWIHLNKLTRDLIIWRPQHVILEYTPQIFAPEHMGVHPIFPVWFLNLKKALAQKDLSKSTL